MITYFNSIKVRLKHKFSERVSMFTLFQFHKGTIKTPVSRRFLVKSLHFNSIKVRLKLPAQRNIAEMTIFQFHKGTIKTRMSIAQMSAQIAYFNSIKVRLKLMFNDELDKRFRSFQFHKGTIKTYRWLFCSCQYLISIP